MEKSLTHAPSSAHPRPDRDGSLWNFGHVPWADKLILYHFGHDGVLKRSAILNAPEAGMVHDFAVTDRSLILVIPPLRYDPHRADHTSSFLDMHRWHEAQPVEIMVIDKSSLEIRRTAIAKAGSVAPDINHRNRPNHPRASQ
jgi:all-trans-8'-apo-beta-carotenal 15,15'-oxygenase